jgi:hypothetical protein
LGGTSDAEFRVAEKLTIAAEATENEPTVSKAARIDLRSMTTPLPGGPIPPDLYKHGI